MDTGILNVIVLRMEAGENPALPRNCKQLRKPQVSHFSNMIGKARRVGEAVKPGDLPVETFEGRTSLKSITVNPRLFPKVGDFFLNLPVFINNAD